MSNDTNIPGLEFIFMLSDLKRNLKTRNRFFTKSPILDYIKKYSSRATMTIKKDNLMWRARKWKSSNSESDSWISLFENNMTESMLKTQYKLKPEELKGPFWGYNEEGSYIPKTVDQVNDARSNPKYITYLYAAEEIITAIAEIRPRPCSLVNVAKIQVLEDLKIYDFAWWGACDDSSYENLIKDISYTFSTPVDGELEDYLVSQYLSEYIKSLGFDGIRFWSSMMGYKKNSFCGNGTCVTIFNHNKCKAIGSEIHRINSITINSNCVFPSNR